MSKIYLCSIAAVAKNNVIGKDNKLLWHIPENLKHFKSMTSGKPMVMGRKTYESFGKPLPGRPHLVVSRTAKKLGKAAATKTHKELESGAKETKSKIDEGPFLYPTITESIAAARKMAEDMGVNEIMIIGGGQIYRETMPIIDRLYLTLIDKNYEGDTIFPDIDWHEWNIISEDRREGDAKKGESVYTFFTLQKKKLIL